MSVPTVGKLSIFWLIIYFCLYLGVHIAIGYLKKQAEEEMSNKPGNEDIENRAKLLKIAFNWWPAIAVIVIVAILYFQ